MRKQALILVFVALVLGLSLPALAQTGTVKGYVKDDTGKPVTNAVVEMSNLDNGRKVTLKTDKSGKFFSIGVADRHLQSLRNAGRQGDLRGSEVPGAGRRWQSGPEH